MRKWLRQIISGLIALLMFAMTYPNVIGHDGVIIGAFIYILCLSIVPFIVIFISVGRSVIWERIGWGLQIVIFMMIIFG